ncbi:glycosyltransferase family 4 protein [Acaryochloris sp. IP29b_bin.137]|uniref:glycosyltransferase family 4 protein n=1 Tax=Acaryochloris sp. IP29b_bin.137 TaxID=2969217 RepID=UPI0026073146|nr:glycosyltransferase family 4 protein [Acaryochloris sp. IP29b_bin.137]
MGTPSLRVLFVVEECNPNWSSVPLEGYHYFRTLNNLVDVTLVTHERNRAGLEKANISPQNITYISESTLAKRYYQWALRLIPQGMNNWPLYHVLTYPIYAEFNHKVYEQFHTAVEAREYDLVHALTPMMPRYPVKLVQACQQTPFLLGPVNGGIPFSEGFPEIAKQEFAYLNFFRSLGRWLIPGYRQTYEQAHRVLAGSTYTYQLLKRLFDISDDRIQIFYENGIAEGVFTPAPPTSNNTLKLLFVGRLVPYKCADVVVEVISRLPSELRSQVHLTIVGDGPQRSSLAAQVSELELEEQIQLVGWVEQTETAAYYQQADVFCFPSVREFGGAVVLEAMACGLPCIVVNYGGVGEYVTTETGFKLAPVSRSQLVTDMMQAIQTFCQDRPLLEQMSQKAVQRAAAFQWPRKAQAMVEIYHKLLP